MRSVNRGPWPTENGQRISLSPFQKAKRPLKDRIGDFCSYCERPGDLHAEHVIPKSIRKDLESERSNFLLGCVNCNSRKLKKNNSRERYLWPDQDETFGAFAYGSDGRESVIAGMEQDLRRKASALFNLAGLGAEETNSDGRRRKRRKAWRHAVLARSRVRDNNTRNLAVQVAEGTGFFSVWMTVFRDDELMRQKLIEAFPGTRM